MLRNLFSTRAILANSALSAWGRGADDLDMGIANPAGVRVTEDSALSVMAVMADVRLISELVATMPLEAFKSGDVVPAPDWTQRPNPELFGVDWLSQTMTSLLLRGNSYDVIVRSSGMTRELWKLHPDEVTVLRPRPGAAPVYYVRGQFIEASNILHIRGFALPGKVTGIDPISYAATALGLGIAAQEYGARFFGQSAMPAAVIESPGVITQDQVEALREQFARWHSGLRNAHKPVVLAGGAAYKPVSILPEQAQFLQTRQLTDSQIHRLFGINPFSDGESMTYANVEQRGIDVVKYTTNPWTVRIETALSSLCEPGMSLKFNVDSLQRADLRTRYESHRVAIEAGFLTVDEVREIEDRPALGDGAGNEGAQEARAIAELIQKIYLGVDTVITADEARAIANRAGADLVGSLPEADAAPVTNQPELPMGDPQRNSAKGYEIEYAHDGRVTGLTVVK